MGYIPVRAEEAVIQAGEIREVDMMVGKEVAGPFESVQMALFTDDQSRAPRPFAKAVSVGSRPLVDQLIADTHLYASSDAVKDLLDFTSRMRRIAPFNAMLLHVQKPGLSYAMTARDWWSRFYRYPSANACKYFGLPPAGAGNGFAACMYCL